MTIHETPIARRNLMRAGIASAVAVPLGTSLASCATSGGGNDGDKEKNASDVKKSDKNPFGVAKDTTVEAVIFKGGYGIGYAKYAGKLVHKHFPSVKMKVKPQTNIAQTLQPRFVSGNPPDVIDNSGANLISFRAILDKLEDLDDVVEAKNYDGEKIKDTLYPGSLEPGKFNDKLAAINYVLTVYAVWYSKSLFDKHDWKPPKTWDEAYDLGKEAKKADKYLFCWGKEAASYYTHMAICSAIKEGGDDVRLKLANLKPKCWSDDAMQKVLHSLKKLIDAGMFKPGGQGTEFTKAQAQWSNAQDALLYPSGGWIENEMKDQTKENFQMTGFPAPTVSKNPTMPYKTLRSQGGEGYIVPSDGKNVAGGKEFMRAMLSKDAAKNFAKKDLAPTIVKDTVPDDGFGSTALKSQKEMLEAAGDDVISWKFVDNYGMNDQLLVLWNAFLAGKSSVKEVTDGMQKLTDKIRNDDSVKKIKVT